MPISGYYRRLESLLHNEYLDFCEDDNEMPKYDMFRVLEQNKYNRNLNAEFACRKPTGASWLRSWCRRQNELLQVKEEVGSFMSSRRLAKKG